MAKCFIFLVHEVMIARNSKLFDIPQWSKVIYEYNWIKKCLPFKVLGIQTVCSHSEADTSIASILTLSGSTYLMKVFFY